MKFPKLLIATLSTVVILGCNDDSKRLSTQVLEAPLPPRVLSAEKYMDYTDVCADCNGNMQCDSDEQSVKSDEAGRFHFPENLRESLASCPLVADVELPASESNSEVVTVKMASPAGCSYVTPLTSLMHHDMSLQLSSTEANEKFKKDVITDMNACVDFHALKNGTKLQQLEGVHLQEIATHFMSSMLDMHIEINSLDDLQVTEKDKHHFSVHKYLKDIDTHTKSVIDKRYENQNNSSAVQESVGAASSSNLSASEFIQQLNFLSALQAAKPLNLRAFFLNSSEQKSIYTYPDTKQNLAWVSNQNVNVSDMLQTVTIQHRDYSRSEPRVLSAKTIGLKNGQFVLNDFSEYYFKSGTDSNRNGIVFTNASAPNYQFMLSGSVAKVKGLNISTPFALDGINSWHDATKANGQVTSHNRFLNNDNMEIYQLKETVYKPNILYPAQPEKDCAPQIQDGDSYSNLCHYVQRYHLKYTGSVYLPIQNTFITKDVLIHSNSDADVSDLLSIPAKGSNGKTALYLSKNNIHGSRPAYFFDSPTSLIGVSFARGTIAPPNTAVDGSELGSDPHSVTRYISSWSEQVANGINVITVQVPAIIQRKYSISNKVYIAKIGNYYRFIDFKNKGEVQNKLGASLETHNRIRQGINKDQIKE
ncbi:hypothetical protein D5018_20820 [Parashewanella curva]|uniref:Uncharacterized protein n=1 Tax=Parashewanella curva TaxID=2338552 RepID=A0A3L8PRD2_9GAMM|nr:hypothetical protein [Parashewanella curva]RLV57764.1 hypothetical protein D5018_20820 [Parashewanella curva]